MTSVFEGNEGGGSALARLRAMEAAEAASQARAQREIDMQFPDSGAMPPPPVVDDPPSALTTPHWRLADPS